MDIRRLEDENLHSLHILAGRILTGLWRKQNIVRLSYLNDKKYIIDGVKNLLTLLKKEGLIEEFLCATKKEIDWDYLQEERGEDFEDDSIDNIYNNWLSTLPKEELVAMHGPSVQKDVCEINVRVFAPNKFEEFYQRVCKERHRRLGMDYTAPPHFDKESGKFVFNGKTIKVRKGDLTYRLVEFLYASPNSRFSYVEIAVAIGLIEKMAKETTDPVLIKAAHELKKEGREGIAKLIERLGTQNAISVPMKKRINQLVFDIKTRLGLSNKDESLFVCNKGYMMKR